MHRLEKISGSRIILVGGSNLAFGVDSISLEEAFHLPVVNMGLHGALGPRFMLSQVKPYIHKGDLVIVALEYELLDGLTNGGNELFDLLTVYPQASLALSLNHIETFFEIIPGLLRKKILFWQEYGYVMPVEDSIYKRSKFNAQGDLILNSADSNREQHLHSLNLVKRHNLENVQLLKEFSGDCLARGAKVYFAFTPIPLTSYKSPGNRSFIDEAAMALKNKSECSVLGCPEDNTYAAHDFYDFHYHLTPGGKASRTKILIRDLKEALKGV